jgi:hypothetical protein
MKIAILYTSYRQLAELDLTPEFYRRNQRLRTEIDIVYHCNNAGVSTAEIEAKWAKIPCKSLTLLHRPCNAGGYAYGQFEAICDAWETLIAGGWDWVIQLHPDVFITDADRLLETVDEATKQGAGMIVSAVFGLKHPSYGTTFFAFRPDRVPKQVFGCWEDFAREPIIVPLEQLFFVEVHRQKIPVYSAMRYKSGTHFYDPDHLGLWHEHNLERVALYLQEPRLRWKVTRRRVLRHPLSALHTVRTWLKRRRQGVPLDSLGQYLSVIGVDVKGKKSAK